MFKFVKRIKEKINKMLLRMAETNRKEFGTKRLDCCEIKNLHNTNKLRNE